MYSLHLQKSRQKSKEVLDKKALLWEIFKENRELLKSEAKINNEGRRQIWMSGLGTKFKNLLVQNEGLLHEFKFRLRERQKNRELTKDGFTKLNFETTKERAERVSSENKKALGDIREPFKGDIKINLRSRAKGAEIQQPMTFT